MAPHASARLRRGGTRAPLAQLNAPAISEVTRAVPQPSQRGGLLARSRGAVRYAAGAAMQAIHLARHHPGERRGELVRTYLRLKRRHFLSKLSSRFQFREETLFGARMECFDYFDLLCTFEVVFVGLDYEFASDQPAPLIIDCGSNIGLSLLFFKLHYPQARILAFEPDLQTFQVLQRNVERNRWSGIELHNRAVLAAPGPVDLFVDAETPGRVTMSTRKEWGLSRRVPAQAVRLSDHIAEDVDFLKLDIEGAEAEVLAELAENGKLRRVRQMTVEVHHHLAPNDDSFSGILRLLEENGFGYQLAAANAGAWRPRQPQNIQLYAYRKS
jgi:FkbM family methyltransferase